LAVLRRSLCVLALAVAVPRALRAQTPPVIDSIAIETFDIFTPEEAEGNPLARVMNALHFRTNGGVVRKELLFHVGDTLDIRRLRETERNLRRLGIFSRVAIDTVRDGGRLVTRVFTSDGWTTNVDAGFSVTGNTLTWRAGLVERNLLGTGHTGGFVFRKDPDRNALRLLAQLNRPLGSHATVGGYYDNLSDGRVGAWAPEVQYLSLSQRWAGGLPGEAADQRILLFRDGVQSDSLWRRALIQRAWLAWAPTAGPGGYVRLGLYGHVRREEFIAIADTALPVPDSLSAVVGPYIEVLHPRFLEVTHYNGFARDEDIDLSAHLSVTLTVAPSAWGYARDGVGGGLAGQVGAGTSRAFARLQVGVTGLVTSAGLDSGQVRANVTLASRALARQATVLHVEGGMQKNPVPGAEFDIGHGIGPRGFEPHAFTGTRTLWGVIEHRVFLWDAVANLFGVGVAGFVDYGGAWYEDQSARFGGDTGVGLRLGGTTSTGPNVARLDLAYRFGDGWSGSRWVVSLGQAFEF
jgi:hypothetical protein